MLAGCAQLPGSQNSAPAATPSPPAGGTSASQRNMEACRAENAALKASLSEAEAKIRALTNLEHKMDETP
jgi:hypothetical protein